MKRGKTKQKKSASGASKHFNRVLLVIPPLIFLETGRGIFEVVILSGNQFVSWIKGYRRYCTKKGFVPYCDCLNEHGVYDYDLDLKCQKERGIL